MMQNEKRNQIDVILHNNRYPKLSIPVSEIDLFFIETISSFIEIKSKLTKDDIRKTARVSRKIKEYPYNIKQKFNTDKVIINPRPYSFIFAYDSDAKDIEINIQMDERNC